MYDVKHEIKLSQNENPLGPSPKALAAIRDFSSEAHRYPEPHSGSLKNKLAEKLNLQPNNIFVSAGLVESLDILIRNFIANSENMIIPELSFVAYKLLANVFGVNLRLAPMKNYEIDIDTIISLCDHHTKVIILASPNNPTGTVVSEADLIKLLQSVPSSTYVVLDEAYVEYLSPMEQVPAIQLQEQYENLIVMRTFSKIYGLAGLRVGYTIAHPGIIEKFDYFQPPFTVNKLASLAALAAIDDDQYVLESSQANREEREIMYRELKEMGYQVVSSKSNFLLVHFNTKEERDKVYDSLTGHNILIRKTDPFGDQCAFRITIGNKINNKKVLEYFKTYTLTA